MIIGMPADSIRNNELTTVPGEPKLNEVIGSEHK